jgi:hypothetical protein
MHCRHFHHTFIIMDPLVRYYLRQAGRSYRRGDNDIGHVYSTSPFLQRGHGLGSFLSGLFRTLRPILWSGVKSLGREALRTGGNILSDIADKTNDVTTRNIVTKHLTETKQRLISKLRGQGRKRKRITATRNKKKSKKTKLTKTDIFS